MNKQLQSAVVQKKKGKRIMTRERRINAMFNIEEARKHLAEQLKFYRKYMQEHSDDTQIIWISYLRADTSAEFAWRTHIITYKEYDLISDYLRNFKDKLVYKKVCGK